MPERLGPAPISKQAEAHFDDGVEIDWKAAKPGRLETPSRGDGVDRGLVQAVAQTSHYSDAVNTAIRIVIRVHPWKSASPFILVELSLFTGRVKALHHPQIGSGFTDAADKPPAVRTDCGIKNVARCREGGAG